MEQGHAQTVPWLLVGLDCNHPVYVVQITVLHPNTVQNIYTCVFSSHATKSKTQTNLLR